MGLSLRELKEQLMAKEGYTAVPNHNHLADLKALVDDMMVVRSASPPSTGSGSYSGTTCNGHITQSEYKLSLGDIAELDIKGCSCHTVNDTTAYCRSRTYSCSCNSNTPTCDCNLRTGTCSCNSNTPICTCNSRTPERCDCFARTYAICLCRTESLTCDCYSRTNGSCTGYDVGCNCDLRTNTPLCECDSRTPSACLCVSRTSSCGTVSPSECTCVSRTSSCGSRSTTSCTCNGRCACNSEKRFG